MEHFTSMQQNLTSIWLLQFIFVICDHIWPAWKPVAATAASIYCMFLSIACFGFVVVLFILVLFFVFKRNMTTVNHNSSVQLARKQKVNSEFCFTGWGCYYRSICSNGCFTHAVASSSLNPAVFLCQQLLVNICPPSLLLSSIRIRCREASRLTTSSVGTTGMQEQNSMVMGKTFKIINFKVLPQNGHFLAGGKGIFPQVCKEKEKSNKKKIFFQERHNGHLLIIQLSRQVDVCRTVLGSRFWHGRSACQENTGLIRLYWE